MPFETRDHLRENQRRARAHIVKRYQRRWQFIVGNAWGREFNRISRSRARRVKDFDKPKFTVASQTVQTMSLIADFQVELRDGKYPEVSSLITTLTQFSRY